MIPEQKEVTVRFLLTSLLFVLFAQKVCRLISIMGSVDGLCMSMHRHYEPSFNFLLVTCSIDQVTLDKQLHEGNTHADSRLTLFTRFKSKSFDADV